MQPSEELVSAFRFVLPSCFEYTPKPWASYACPSDRDVGFVVGV